MTQYWESNKGSTSKHIVLDSFKTHVRGEYRTAIKAGRSNLSSQIQQVEDCELKAAETLSDSPTADNFELLAQTRLDLSLHMASATHLDLRTVAGRVFESGDKNGKVLAKSGGR